MVLFAILLMIVNAVGLALVAAGLPGNWLMVACTLLAQWGYSRAGAGNTPLFSPGVLLAVILLAIAGEVLEFIAGLVGAKRAGGTRYGAWGAVLGTIAGGIAGTFVIALPVIGSLIGACAGAALGAILLELHGGTRPALALRSGAGAGIGRLIGTLAKLAVGAAIWLVVTVAAFWP